MGVLAATGWFIMAMYVIDKTYDLGFAYNYYTGSDDYNYTD